MRYISINIIMFVLLACGLYSKTSYNKLFTALAKVYCTCFVIIVLYINFLCIHDISEESQIYICNLLVLYVCMYMTSLLSDGENFYKCVSDLDTVCDIGQQKGILSFLIFVLILLYNVIKFYVFLDSYETYFVINMLSFSVVSAATMLSHMTKIMIFNILWFRMRALRMRTERCLFVTEGFDEEQSLAGARALEENLIIYKRLVDSLKHFGNASKLLIVLNFPSYLIYASQFAAEVVNETWKQYENNLFIFYIMETLIRLVLPLVPAILCELIRAEIDKMKLHLIKTIYLVQNKMLSFKISDGLKFLEVVPCRYSVWRFFNLDISMPMGLISLCTTYVIAYLQFRKMYT